MASYLDDFLSGVKRAIPQAIPEPYRSVYGGIQQFKRRGAAGIGEDVANVASGVGSAFAYGTEGKPAVRPTESIPSGFLKRQVEGIGNAAIDRASAAPAPIPSINPLAGKYGSGPTNIRAGATMPAQGVSQVAAPAVDPQAARIKAYEDFMQGSLARGKEYFARLRANEGPRMASPKAREEQARQMERLGMENAQANVAGEREAGVEKFKAEKAAEGMIGAKKAAAEGEEAVARAKGEYDVKAAEAKAGATSDKDRAKMLKDYSVAIANSEPGSPAHVAAVRGLQEMFSQQATGIDAQAVEWAKKNPKDPRSAAILAKNGIKA